LTYEPKRIHKDQIKYIMQNRPIFLLRNTSDIFFFLCRLTFIVMQSMLAWSTKN